jgi:CelD/BcsL family acetyltransferase involved in cellulose biosynthesis
MQIEEITTIDHLEQLRPEWTELWRRCAGATPFQSPAWLIPWWRHIGEGTLRTLAIRVDGRLAGLAPFYIYTQESGRRDVFLLGIGTSDYLDVLADEQYLDTVLSAAMSYLDDIRDQWDVCDLQQLRPDSPLVSAMPPADWAQELAWQEVCPVLWLDSQPECLEPPSKLPQKMLENVRYYQRRLSKLGSVTYEEACEDNLYELFYSLLDLHAARWSTKGESGVLWVAPVQMAHQEALPELLALGVLRMHALRLDGRLIAVLYGLADPELSGSGRVYYYLSGFDPEFEPHSPGTLIVAHAIFEAQRSGACAFDFLRGKEDYKYRWGAVDTFTYRRQLRAPK